MKKFFCYILMALVSLQVYAQNNGEYERLTNLPHIYLNTFTGYDITSKTVSVLARMWYVDEQDNVTFYDSLEVRIRGNSTASLAKKPYRLKLYEKTRLLGKDRAKAKKWTLLANHGDKTLIRNALTSLMGEKAGLPFNPAAKFVDLTLNGQYVGNYQLSDQVEVRSKRVDIAEQDYPLTDGSNITGGYLLEADGFRDFVATGQTQPGQTPTGFYSSRYSVPIRIHYPDDDEIDGTQYAYIRNFVNNFERQLFAADFDDPQSGYRSLVDSTTLVNWYLCTEISANIDGFFSTYFYKQQDDDRLYWGPLWDYDIAYNNDNRSDRGGTSNTEQQLMSDVGYGLSNGCLKWVQRFWEDPWFAQLVKRRYKELVDDGLESYLYEKIDSLTTLLEESQQLNYQRWGINVRTLRERVLHSTYNEYIDDLRSFIHNHMLFLTSTFIGPDTPGPDEPKTPDFVANRNSYYAIVNSGTGTCFDLNGNEVCGRHRQEGSETQQWSIVNLSNGYLYITNRATGQALTDGSPAGSTATTQTGTVLSVGTPDSTSTAQQWDIVAQTDGRYNIVSRWSQHAANLSGGNAADGTNIISYNSDDRNAISANRLWYIETVTTGIDDVVSHVETDYALAFDPQRQFLHFGADNPAELSFQVAVYAQHGRRRATFRASDGCSLSSLPHGLYIVSWKHDGRQRSVKIEN